MMEGIRLICWMLTLMLVLGSDLRHVEAKKMDLESVRCGVSDMEKVDELKLFTPGTYTTRSSNSRSERSTWHQMKFEVHYDETVINSTQRDLIMNITQESVDLISRQLEVREEPATITLPRDCETGPYVNNGTLYNCTCSRPICGYVQIPEHHLKPCLDCKFYKNGTEYDCEPQPGGPSSRGAIDVHYILYVISIACRAGIVGFANACYIDQTYNRPNVGFINFCPDFLDIFNAQQLQITAQHEINHALGISSGLFAFYRDENGDPLTPLGENGIPLERHPDRGSFQWSDRVVRTKTLEWDVRGGTIERNVSIMVTPNLIREARDFFGCDTIEGVELEDDYGRIPSGSALSHFELRLMQAESMNPAITFNGRSFSRFTLAFFEDTGWYRANYDLADPYEYGRNLGCDYVHKSCKWWMDTQRQRKESLSPYCENPLELVCSVEGDAAAQCTNIIHDEPLPSQYQYFDSFLDLNETELAKVGGYADFAGNCPIIYPRFQLQTNDYRRQTCDKEIDECSSNPCGNGATCSDIITGYFCTCAAGYEGRHCTNEKTSCTTTEQCTQNEVCADGLCSCGYGRIRTNGACLIPRRFIMALQLTKVNISLAIYPDILNTDETAIKREIEYAIFLRLSRWEIFVESVLSVDVTSFFNGSLWVGVQVILEPDSTPNDVTIYTLMSDTYFYDSTALSSTNTVFTLSNLTVQDLDECNMAAYSACSVYSTCNNTLGSYQCTCMPGFVDQGDVIDRPGTLCIDIDECSNSSLNECSLFSQCNNTPGDYDCTCLSGYVDNGPVNGRSGVSCTDIDECISNPCLNGGACWNFKDRFTCECPLGYEGRFCETVISSCASEDLCSQIDHEFCDASGLCKCRPGYLRQNGICQAIATYTGSLSFTSLNGQPLVYTTGLSHSSRPAFNQMAQQFRGALLSTMPDILDVSITSFRSGSVIAEFNVFVTDGTSRATVTTAIMTGIGDGTLLVGEDIVDVDPSSMSIADLDECMFGELNDCSPVAECTNMDGTFSCTCSSGYIDTSPTGAGLGKQCSAEEVPDDGGVDSTSIITILAIVLCVVFIIIGSMIAVLICCRLSSKKLRGKRERRQNDDEDIIYANPDTRLRAHLQHESNLPVYGFDNHLDSGYPISFREARGHRTRHDRPGHRYDPDRRGQLRTVSNAVLGFDQRIDPRFDRGFGPGNSQLRLEYPLYHRSSSPTRYMNGAQANLKSLPY